MGIGAGGFVADEEIEPSVIIIVGPGSRLRGVQRHEACLFGDVFEGAIAVVLEQGHRVFPVFAPPTAAENQHIGMAVVVVVSGDDVQAADLAG